VFAFSAAAGPASFTLSPAARSPNLDALISLRNSAGVLLGQANPLDALNASLSLTLPVAGSYYLSVQGTGKGDPLVTGYSNYGSVGQYALSASYPSAGSQAPIAAISASTLRGTAPLNVSFSGAGSSDPDGSLVAYDWSFGDGGSASGVSSAHSYASPGSYSAQLRVTDNSGLSAASSVTITVDAPVAIVEMRVADIAMSLNVAKNGNAQAGAAVKVLSAAGLPVAGATVTGKWSGLVSSNAVSAVTDSTGVARFSSPSTRKTGGSFVYSVTGVSLSGYSYAPLTNTETSDSIAR